MSKIERANQTNKFSEAELRAKVKESKIYWSSPAGQAEMRKQKSRKPAPPTAPPSKRKSEHPSVSAARHRLNILN